MAKRKPKRKPSVNKKAKRTEEECSSTTVDEGNAQPTMGASSTVEQKEELPEDDRPTLGTEEESLADNTTTNTNVDEHVQSVEHPDISDIIPNIIPNEDVLDPDNPSEEFVFAPIIAEQLEEVVAIVNLITPSTSRHSTTSMRDNAGTSSSAGAAKTKDSERNNTGGECSHTLLIEVIDVDDLPDTPTPLSSIGDDVIEITPDNSIRGESPEIVLDRHVVDLTGNGDAESTSSTHDIDDDLSDIDDDALLSIWSRMSKKRKSLSSSSGANKSSEDKPETEKPELDDSQSRNKLNCPICMDDFSTIVKDRRLMSTSCGHVFCDVCIKAAVETQKKCPTCRKKQLPKNLHPIFL